MTNRILVGGPERLPRLRDEELSEAQRRVAEALAQGPRGAVRGPFIPMLRSPEFMDRAQRLGEYLRYHSQIPQRLREFAIVVSARYWDQAYEWSVHAAFALAAGVQRAVLEDIAAVRRPDRAPDDERIIYDFCTQLHREHCVDDAAYERALQLLGEPGVIDLCGICGYYAMLAMVMNVARTPSPGIPFQVPE